MYIFTHKKRLLGKRLLETWSDCSSFSNGFQFHLFQTSNPNYSNSLEFLCFGNHVEVGFGLHDSHMKHVSPFSGGPRKVEARWSQDQTMFEAWRDGCTGYIA